MLVVFPAPSPIDIHFWLLIGLFLVPNIYSLFFSNSPSGFLFCFVLLFFITKKRKVQATEPASAEPENDAEMKHTVPLIVFLYIT